MDKLKPWPERWENAVNLLNDYCTAHYIDMPGEESRKVADAINDILPFAVWAYNHPAPENKSHWIPVRERLPEIQKEPSSEFTSDVGKCVLVCDADGYIYEATYWKIGKKFQEGGFDCAPSYWMPLPEPPDACKPEQEATP